MCVRSVCCVSYLCICGSVVRLLKGGEKVEIMNCVLFHSYIFCLRWLSWTDVLVQVRVSSLLFASYEDCANQTSCTDMPLDDYQRVVFCVTNASTVWSGKVATLVLTNSFWLLGWKEHMFSRMCCHAVIVWADLSLWQPSYTVCTHCWCTTCLKLSNYAAVYTT